MQRIVESKLVELEELSRRHRASPHSPVAPFVAYVLVFFIAWSTLWVWGVYPWAVRHLGDTTLAYASVNLAFRFAIWVLRVFLYLRRVDHVNPVEYLQLPRFPPFSSWEFPYLDGRSLAR